MKERPIIFSGEMVKAILDGCKTQTRRVIRKQPTGYTPRFDGHPDGGGWCWIAPQSGDDGENYQFCPYGAAGDRLWVRETWAYLPKTAYGGTVNPSDPDMVAVYKAGFDRCAPGWKPSIHMPRWASRITLEITGVRVERVQDISEEDAKAEGWRMERYCPFVWYSTLWDSHHGKGAWDENPWVWVLSFRKLEKESSEDAERVKNCGAVVLAHTALSIPNSRPLT